ncbi:Uncharacterised protein [Staphylococcus aureus]|nr:Uncharacterised protein [Staphylococcus aureus]
MKVPAATVIPLLVPTIPVTLAADASFTHGLVLLRRVNVVTTLPLRLITNLSAYVVTLPACVLTVWFAPGAIVIAPAAVSVTVGFDGWTSFTTNFAGKDVANVCPL